MKTTAVTFEDLAKSVIAVPPLARNADFSLNMAANAKVVKHLEAGGVRSLMYGGNANFYNISLKDFAVALDGLEEQAGPDTWVLPAIGPDFGKMMDQADILRSRKFPTAMVLPLVFPATPAGAEIGIRKVVERFGKPVTVYVKSETYLTPEGVGRLVNDGVVSSIKYAIVRDDPAKDAFLTKLCDLIDKRFIVSGIGERPAVIHFRDFGLSSFTSGSISVAPRGTTAMLKALTKKDWATAEKIRAAYLRLEDLRDSISPIRVLHDAVTFAGIADMGPMLPLLTRLDEKDRPAVEKAAKELFAKDKAWS